MAEKLPLVDEFVKSQETFEVFCARRKMSTASLCKWRRALRARGEAGLAPKPNRRNLGGTRGSERTPEARRQAVEAFAKSGMRQEEFARLTAKVYTHLELEDLRGAVEFTRPIAARWIEESREAGSGASPQSGSRAVRGRS